ncbi:MAG TPA: LuxR C-terminal-related transcriptional regulator [Acidimicrobiales bacterium]|nr:LuxR C-terminal-related transcriptional regulator [Acidimicrobiales bacterium]
MATLAVPDAGGPAQFGVVASGTGGAAAVIAAIVDRLRARDVPVVRASGRRLEGDDAFGAVRDLVEAAPVADAADGATTAADERAVRDALVARLAGEAAALVVDEAQWLDPASLRVVIGVAERAAERGFTVVVAHRPVAGNAQLAALDAVLGRSQMLVALGPLDESEVGELSAIVLDSAVDDRLVDAVHDQTRGMPDLVELLLSAWVDAGTVRGGKLTGPPPPPGPSLVAALRARVDELEPATRTVLEALSAGADLDDHLLSATTDISPDRLGDAIDDLHAAGLVVPGTGDVVPLVAAAADEMTPVADRRRFHSRLAAALAERGAPATRTGEHLAAAGAQGPGVAAAYVAAGDATLTEAPELASGWYDRAIAAGTTPSEIAARRAEAAALSGDAVTALHLADAVIAEPAGHERERALAVAAALLPSRGFWRRSATAYRELADLARARTVSGDTTGGRNTAAWPLLAAIGELATGATPGDDTAGSSTVRDEPSNGGPGRGDAGSGAVTGLEIESLRLTRDALIASTDPQGGHPLPAFLEAAELLESAHTSVVLPTTPHAIGATVGMALNELSTADHLLSRARDHAVGGATLQQHHRLALGWLAVRSGRWAVAQAALDEVGKATLPPREVLTAAAIDAGLARRSGDLARLGEAWERAEGVLLRHPADLFSLEVVGELAIGASRLGLWDRVAPKARELGDVVRALGEPPLWLLPLRWIGLQVALATDDHEAAIRRAAEVEATKPVHPRLGALADAARTWVAILGGTADPDGVAAAAKGLAGLGLTWEASRLTGQAAIRSSDPTVTRALLEQARDLKAALPTSDPAEASTTASVLSEREQMVAQYIVDGLTHKEIGAQLYISPKTVEHHVAKIRQKLGASTRAEMLAALRSQLAA